MQQAAEAVKAKHGGLDILVCNAGFAFKGDAFDEHVARTTLGINYFGTLKNIEVLFFLWNFYFLNSSDCRLLLFLILFLLLFLFLLFFKSVLFFNYFERFARH